MRIGTKCVGGRGAGVYVIAEIGVNHDGDVGRALGLVEEAARVGADAVKFQYFEAELLVGDGAGGLAEYQRAAGECDAKAMLGRLELSIDGLAMCIERAEAVGVASMVSVFSAEHVGAVAMLGCDALKSASTEIVNKGLLGAMAGTGLPMVVSTGASELGEVERAAGWLGGDGEGDGGVYQRLGLMQCVSSYPVPAGQDGMEGIGALYFATGLPVGYSDHTTGVRTGAHAVSRWGAVMLEKHLTYDRGAAGPDHAASLDPSRFAEYVRHARGVERCGYVAGGEKRVLACEREVRAKSRQSVVVVRDVAAGGVIGVGDVGVRRPGTGIEAWRMGEVVGRVAARGLRAGEVVGFADLEGGEGVGVRVAA